MNNKQPLENKGAFDEKEYSRINGVYVTLMEETAAS